MTICVIAISDEVFLDGSAAPDRKLWLNSRRHDRGYVARAHDSGRILPIDNGRSPGFAGVAVEVRRLRASPSLCVVQDQSLDQHPAGAEAQEVFGCIFRHD